MRRSCRLQDRVSTLSLELCCVGKLTSGNAVDLVLDEEVDQRDEGAEECAGKVFPQLDGPRVWRAQG